MLGLQEHLRNNRLWMCWMQVKSRNQTVHSPNKSLNIWGVANIVGPISPASCQYYGSQLTKPEKWTHFPRLPFGRAQLHDRGLPGIWLRKQQKAAGATVKPDFWVRVTKGHPGFRGWQSHRSCSVFLFSLQASLTSGFHLGSILCFCFPYPPAAWGHLAIFKDIFGCHNWKGATGTQQIKAKDGAKRPTVQRTVPQRSPTPENTDRVEKAWARLSFSVYK